MNKLRVLLIGSFITLLVLTLSAVVIGSMMEPEHRVTRQADYQQTPAQLWRVITRFDQTPSWRSDVHGLQIEGGNPVRFVELGDRGPLPMEVVEQDAPHRLIVMTRDIDLPFSGAWTFELEPTDEGTRLSITEDIISTNPLVRVIRSTFQNPAKSTDTYLIDLGRHLGQNVTPQPQS